MDGVYSISNVAPPTFLDLPTRAAKPRAVGLTHVLDKGRTVEQTKALLDHVGAHIDIWKFGWGTAYLDADLAVKLEMMAEAGVRSCLGGTLLEVAWSQCKDDECLTWAEQVGFASVEVSRGVAPMSPDDKRDLLRRAATRFVVLSEVGSKDPADTRPPEEWTDEVAGDIDAGARWVITEGRESGTVGIYRSDGSVRADIVSAAVRGGGLGRLLFEAPRKDQQAWLIRTFGPDVNLANIASDEVLAVETLRLGLRADTFDLSRQRQSV